MSLGGTSSSAGTGNLDMYQDLYASEAFALLSSLFLEPIDVGGQE
jgi:hypothetical protein